MRPLYLALILILLGSCSSNGCSGCEAPEDDVPLVGRWHSYRFPLDIKISRTFETCQKRDIIEGMRTWEREIDDQLFSYRLVPSSDLAVNGLPRLGEIGISPENRLSRPGAKAEAWRTYLASKHNASKGVPYLHSVEIHINKNHACGDDLQRRIAHEIGHSLGFGHSSNKQSLMHLHTGQVITLRQRTWVRGQMLGSLPD